jgi:hypothetical protein
VRVEHHREDRRGLERGRGASRDDRGLLRDGDERGGEGDEGQERGAASDPPLPGQGGGTIRAAGQQQQRGAADEPDGGDQVNEARGDAEDLDGRGLSARR